MKTLEELREDVDRADDAIAAALAARFAATDEIGRVKRAGGVGVSMPSREREIKDRIAAKLPRELVESVWGEIFRISRLRQREEARP